MIAKIDLFFILFIIILCCSLSGIIVYNQTKLSIFNSLYEDIEEKTLITIDLNHNAGIYTFSKDAELICEEGIEIYKNSMQTYVNGCLNLEYQTDGVRCSGEGKSCMVIEHKRVLKKEILK